MNWIVFLIVGGLIGWVGSLIMKTDAQMGLIGNILIGIIGSLLGHWIAGALGIAAAGGILRFLIALGGAVLLIAILRAFGAFR